MRISEKKIKRCLEYWEQNKYFQTKAYFYHSLRNHERENGPWNKRRVRSGYKDKPWSLDLGMKKEAALAVKQWRVKGGWLTSVLLTLSFILHCWEELGKKRVPTGGFPRSANQPTCVRETLEFGNARLYGAHKEKQEESYSQLNLHQLPPKIPNKNK